MTFPTFALGEIFDIARGGSPRPIDKFITDDPDGVNWISISDASDSSKFITKAARKIIHSGVSRSRAVKPGDFLLTNSMSFGRPYIMATSGCIHDGWLVLSPRTKSVDSNFMYHLLGSPAVYAEFKRLAPGATVKNLNIDLVSGVEVPLPSLDEQRRIAAILDQADGLRRLRLRALEKLTAFELSVFHYSFGDFHSNDRNWTVRPLGESLIDVSNGMTRRAKSSEKQIDIVLRLKDIRAGHINFSDVSRISLAHDEKKRFEVSDGDLLFIRVNGNPDYVGRNAVFAGYREPIYFNDHIMRVRVDKKKIDAEFLSFVLNSDFGRSQIAANRKTSAGQHTINQAGLASIKMPMPPLESQREFARAIGRIAEQRRSAEKAADELDALFASLQHRAFRGEL